MKNAISIITISVIFAFSCVSKSENEKVVMENEELKAELTRAQLAMSTLEEVGALMDSIDKSRNALKLELEAGTNYDDYLERMNDINNYVSDTESKINELEQALNQSSTTNRSYIRTINRLKRDIATKTEEIQMLQNSVENYKKETTDLLNVVQIQEAEITDLNDEIRLKMEELEFIEARVQEMMKKAQMTEADSYFALGEALEEAARRTKLAPKKRKETYKEAIEYYKKSLAFGREDAKEKIEGLEQKI
jgi:chromosome segregation ATPase